jgi:hypothetical protein
MEFGLVLSRLMQVDVSFVLEDHEENHKQQLDLLNYEMAALYLLVVALRSAHTGYGKEWHSQLPQLLSAADL